jgi:hypothetical protein
MGIAMVVVACVASIAHAMPSDHRDTHHRPVVDHGGRATPLPAPDLTAVTVRPRGPAELAEVPPLFLATGAPSLLEQRGHDGSPRLGMYILRRPVGMTTPGRMTQGDGHEPGARDRVLGRPAGR